MPTSHDVPTSGSVTAPGTRKHASSLSLGMSSLRTAEGVLSGLRVSRWGHGRAPVWLGQRQRERVLGAPVHVAGGAEHSSDSPEERPGMRAKGSA